jgi:starch synthase
MLKVLLATSEAYPLATTGGLGDVCGSLPKALRALGCDVRLVMPGYPQLRGNHIGFRPLTELGLPGFQESVSVLEGALPSGIPVYAIDCPALFDRPGTLYGSPDGHEWPDNPYRFALFSRAVTALALGQTRVEWRPEMVHCNDWQTALVPALLSRAAPRPRTIFTIHNLAYRGLCSAETFAHLSLPSEFWHPEALEFHGQCALIKGGIAFADEITTVSPTYAWEIQTAAFGYGLEGLLARRAAHLTGILNGADYTLWNPADDAFTARHYDADHLDSKRDNKRMLQRELGLPDNERAFLIGTVTRFAEQKGVDLILAAIPMLADLPVQVAVLGHGDLHLQEALAQLAGAHPDRVAVRFGYDEALSHRLIAGIDALLMPSRYEPCGLTQIYAMRYGVPPIVRRTGGLADTVVDGSNPALRLGTGFIFDEASGDALGRAIHVAYTAYGDKARWRALQTEGMSRDFSWRRSAEAYLEVYERALRS